MPKTIGYCCDTRKWCTKDECKKSSPQSMFAMVQADGLKRINQHVPKHLVVNGSVALSFGRKLKSEQMIEFYDKLDNLAQIRNETHEDLLMRICKSGQKIRVIDFVGLSEYADKFGKKFEVSPDLNLGVLFVGQGVLYFDDKASYVADIPTIAEGGLSRVIRKIEKLHCETTGNLNKKNHTQQ